MQRTSKPPCREGLLWKSHDLDLCEWFEELFAVSGLETHEDFSEVVSLSSGRKAMLSRCRGVAPPSFPVGSLRMLPGASP